MKNEILGKLFKQFLIETIDSQKYAQFMPDLVNCAVELAENDRKAAELISDVDELTDLYLSLHGETEEIKEAIKKHNELCEANNKKHQEAIDSLAQCVSAIFHIRISDFMVSELDDDVMSFTYSDQLIEARIFIDKQCNINVTIL